MFVSFVVSSTSGLHSQPTKWCVRAINGWSPHGNHVPTPCEKENNNLPFLHQTYFPLTETLCPLYITRGTPIFLFCSEPLSFGPVSCSLCLHEEALFIGVDFLPSCETKSLSHAGCWGQQFRRDDLFRMRWSHFSVMFCILIAMNVSSDSVSLKSKHVCVCDLTDMFCLGCC